MLKRRCIVDTVGDILGSSDSTESSLIINRELSQSKYLLSKGIKVCNQCSYFNTIEDKNCKNCRQEIFIITHNNAKR